MRKSKMKQQMYRISAFPLNIIVLPGEEIPLRIYEPRYKQLITEALEYSKPFGIPFLKNGQITDIGSEVEIVKVVGRNANDDMVITIRGISIYKTIEYFPVLQDRLYGVTLSEPINYNFTTTNPDLVVRVKALKLNLTPELGTLIISNSISLFDIAKSLMLKPEEKYKLLTIKNCSDREQFILNQLRFIELIRNQEISLENNFQLN